MRLCAKIWTEHVTIYQKASPMKILVIGASKGTGALAVKRRLRTAGGRRRFSWVVKANFVLEMQGLDLETHNRADALA
jgi:hypothetical protein